MEKRIVLRDSTIQPPIIVWLINYYLPAATLSLRPLPALNLGTILS